MAKKKVSRLLFRLVGAAALAASTLAMQLPAQQQPYHVMAHWKIGGDSRWDYLHIDSASERLYVSHGNKVEVLDAKTGKIVGSIDGLQGSHGIVVDGSGKFGYISDSAGGVVVFDTTTLAKVKTIPTQYGADGIVYEPVTKTVWTYTGRGGQANATGIDTATQEIIAAIPVTTDRLEAETADGKGHVFGNIGGDIARIDAKARKMDAQWSTGCSSASGLAYDAATDHIFQACRGDKMYVVDAKTGKVLGDAIIGSGPDGAGFSAKYHLAFSTTGDGFLSVVDANTTDYPTIEKLATQLGARTMDYDPATDRIFTITAERDPNAPAQSAPPGPPPQQGQGQPGPGGPGGQPGPGGPAGQGGPPPQGPPRTVYLPDTFSVIVIGR